MREKRRRTMLLALCFVKGIADGGAVALRGGEAARRLSADDDMPVHRAAGPPATAPASAATDDMPKLLPGSIYKGASAKGVLADGTVYLERTMGCWSNVGRHAYRPSCHAFSVLGHGTFPRYTGPRDSTCYSCCDTAVSADGDARCWATKPGSALVGELALEHKRQPQWRATSFKHCCGNTRDRDSALKLLGAPPVAAHAFSGSSASKARYYERVDIAKHFYMLYWRPKGGFKSSSEEQAACVIDKAAHMLMFATCTAEELLRPKKSTYRLDCDRMFVSDLVQDLQSCCVGVEHAAMWQSQKRCEATIAPVVKIASSYIKPMAKCVKVVEAERYTDAGEDDAFRALMLKIKGPSGTTSIFHNTNAACLDVRNFATDTYEKAYVAAKKMYAFARTDAAKRSQFPELAAEHEMKQVGVFLKLCQPSTNLVLHRAHGGAKVLAGKVMPPTRSVAGVSTKCHIKLGLAYSESVKIAASLHMTAAKCRKNPTLAPGCEDFWDEDEWRRNWKTFCTWCE